MGIKPSLQIALVLLLSIGLLGTPSRVRLAEVPLSGDPLDGVDFSGVSLPPVPSLALMTPVRLSLSLPEFPSAPRTISGTITRNLFESARARGISSPIIDQIADLLAGKIDFRRDLQPGDTFSVLVSERQSRGGKHEQDLLAVALRNKGRLFAAVARVSAQGSTFYVDQHGAPLGKGFLRYPVAFSRISSTFSTARFHPIFKVKRPHLGVDFAAAVGTPVRSIGDGIVLSAGMRGAAGKMLRIAHGSRYVTEYLHLSSISPRLHKGSYVRRGEVIGAVGMTGAATGPHLHFALFDRGQYVNPLKSPLPEVAPRNSVDAAYAALVIGRLESSMLQFARQETDTIETS